MSARFIIEDEPTVFTVHALKDRLLAALAKSSSLYIQLDDAFEVDDAAIQLLATKGETHQCGGARMLNGHPPQMIAALELAYLMAELVTACAELEATV